MNLSAFIGGIGVLGPGLENWPHAAAVLSGSRPYVTAPTVLPIPAMLPPAERRRTGRVVKLALAVAWEATSNAGADPAHLPSVFSSSGSDGHICHEICEALALTSREVSPTRFSNSVHNVAAGYWSIATNSMAESNVLCAFDASFVAGLLDAMTQIAVDRHPVLFVAYDTEYPPPLQAKRPIPDALGVAMILSSERHSGSIARIDLALTDETADKLLDPELEALRTAIPAARALPLLLMLAKGGNGRVILDYLDVSRAAVQVAPCS
ncbi:MAG TPA: beta-ketoacyl synthase chain length factor [Steroidobacteraceae bacterium]|jgi:ABC-type amino acid transport substrate-binding protein|nr:beta-ketoacyl synthase chain length factor [Steroidobacteraceae bacterium]